MSKCIQLTYTHNQCHTSCYYWFSPILLNSLRIDCTSRGVSRPKPDLKDSGEGDPVMLATMFRASGESRATRGASALTSAVLGRSVASSPLVLVPVGALEERDKSTSSLTGLVPLPLLPSISAVMNSLASRWLCTDETATRPDLPKARACSTACARSVES